MKSGIRGFGGKTFSGTEALSERLLQKKKRNIHRILCGRCFAGGRTESCGRECVREAAGTFHGGSAGHALCGKIAVNTSGTAGNSDPDGVPCLLFETVFPCGSAVSIADRQADMYRHFYDEISQPV